MAFELDQRIARIVAATSEPMLGQMRLAWWRDMLGKPGHERPTGDAVLDAIGVFWQGREDALVRLVDGWEVLIASDTLNPDELEKFSQARAAPYAALFDDRATKAADRVRLAMSTFAIADLATGLSSPEERERAIAFGLREKHSTGAFPRGAKGLRILEALALRALKRGGRPLMEGRGAGLVAARAAFFGR
ncbi:hypothetical protein [Qipengyuania nanhaisediminis]|uniref:hypothetical protein n=1 Tax=Qipengyuania nanhaisediminis TaxID=604088 RepID=UPI0038B28430